MEKESYLYKKQYKKEIALKKDKEFKKLVQCQTCAHQCLILPGKRGICGVRENKYGELFALNYGKIIARNIDPVEKKPLFHFLPGSYTYSVSTVGCNFQCQNCQNYDISQGFKKSKEIPGQDLTPERIVEDAIKNKCHSISYTYTEPTIFLEFAFDCMKLARRKGLKNIWVSNGFMSRESAELIIPYLDANNIDIKSSSDDFYRKNCGAQLKPVLETAKLMKKSGVWVEITTLSMPTLSDSEEMFRNIAEFIKKELGAETPWHISRFSGAISWKLQDIQETPLETLEMAYVIGKRAGLKYVYTGNIPDIPTEDTYCSKCNTLAIDRTGYIVSRYDKDGKCQKCGNNLDLRLK